MAHLYFNRTRCKSGGQAASARITYTTRRTVTQVEAGHTPERTPKDRREDLVWTETRNLPGWAQGNPHTFFQAAERYERANGVAFEEWTISLPRELTLDQNLALVHDLVDLQAGTALPCVVAVHNPRTIDGTQDQPHVHLLLSARVTDGVPSRSAAQHFRRWNAAHPERGGARKAEIMNVYHATRLHRVGISDVMNVHLERAGVDARVHPDSLARRGTPRQTEPKLRHRESREAQQAGTMSPGLRRVLDIRQWRQTHGTDAREQAQARQYWTERKATLGITHRQPMPSILGRVREARRLTARLHDREGQALVRSGQQSVARGLRLLVGRVQGDEGRGHGELHVKIEEERERARGIGW